VVFISIAEDQTGDADFILTPIPFEINTRLNDPNAGFFSQVRLLNTTELNEKLKNVKEIAGSSPRWIFPVELAKPGSVDTFIKAYIILLDQTNERSIGMGRKL
jgi:hypothetical protein